MCQSAFILAARMAEGKMDFDATRLEFPFLSELTQHNDRNSEPEQSFAVVWPLLDNALHWPRG